jgi:hypothetical protein
MSFDPRHHFNVLPREQQQEAMRRLAAMGYGIDSIATATGMAREAVMQVIGPRSPSSTVKVAYRG